MDDCLTMISLHTTRSPYFRNVVNYLTRPTYSVEHVGLPVVLFVNATCFLLVARSDHTTESRNIKLEVVFKVQKMARYA